MSHSDFLANKDGMDAEHLRSELKNAMLEIESLKRQLDRETATRHQAQLILQSREERLRYALDVATDGMWDWDLTNYRVFYSRQWKAMLGYEDAEISDTLEEWISRIHPQDKAEVIEQITSHAQGNTEMFRCEHRMICKSGEIKWTLNEAKRIEIAGPGTQLRIIGTIKDITEKKNVELSLRERIKELKCLGIATSLLNDENLTPEQIFTGIVEAIPAGMQYPEIAGASLSINDIVYSTPEFVQTQLAIEQAVKIKGEKGGKLVVTYTVIDGETEIPAFLPEEYTLIQSIAERIASHIEKRQFETKLRVSEEKYRTLLLNLNDVVFEVNNRGVVTFISEPIVRILGYSADEITGLNFAVIAGLDHEALLKRFEELKEKRVLSSEYLLTSKSGEKRWVRMATKAIFSKGNFIGGAGTVIDITENKKLELDLHRSEKLYRSIINASPDSISVVDVNGYIQFSSPMGAMGFGYKNPEMLKGKHIFSFLDEAEHERAGQMFANWVNEKEIKRAEFKGLRIDGTTFDVEVRGEIIHDENNNISGFLLLSRDITEMREAQLALVNSEKALNNALQIAGIGYWERDLLRDTLSWSNSQYALFGMEKNNGYDTYEKFFSLVHPEDKPLFTKYMNSFTEDNQEVTFTFRAILPDKTEKRFGNKVVATFVDGKLTRLHGINADITTWQNEQPGSLS